MLGWLENASFKKGIKRFFQATVEEEMTKDVFTVDEEDSLIEVANEMIANHYSCLVVTNNHEETPAGIITERDYLLKLSPAVKDLEGLKVKDFMTKSIVSISPELNLADASELMDKHRFRKLVVLEEGRLVGIVTQTDLVRRINEFYTQHPFKTSESLKVKECFKEALRVDASHPLREAHALMKKHNEGSILVCEGEFLKGIFTEFDFLAAMSKGYSSWNAEIGDLCSSPVSVISGEVDVLDANAFMLSKRCRRLPVLDLDREEVVGKTTQTLIRKNSFQLLKETLKRVESGSLKAVNYQALKGRPELERSAWKGNFLFSYPSR